MLNTKHIAILTLMAAIALPTITWASDGPPGPPQRSISLREAHEMAASNNPSFKNMEETVIQADTVISSAWSMLLPHVTAEGSIVRNQQEITMGLPDFSAFDPADPDAPLPTEEVVMQEKWGKSFGFTANMTLFDPRSIPLIKNAYSNADKTRLAVQRHKNDLLFAVTSAYYQCHAIEEMIGVWQENINTAVEFHTLSAARLEAGESTSIDVLRAEIQVIEAKKGRANAEDAVKIAKSALGHLIGLDRNFDLKDPRDIQEVSTELDQLQKQARSKRVDLQEAAITEEMASRSKTETLMKWLPSLDATYDWRWNGAKGFGGEHDTWMFIIGAKWNIFEGGSRISEMKMRKSDIRMAENTSSQVTIDISLEVETAYLEMTKFARNVELLNKQVTLAQENHSLVKKQFEVGLATSLDLQSASAQLATQRNTRVVENLQFDIAKLSLLKAAGQYHELSK